MRARCGARLATTTILTTGTTTEVSRQMLVRHKQREAATAGYRKKNEK